jgi:hypothetical protein
MRLASVKQKELLLFVGCLAQYRGREGLADFASIWILEHLACQCGNFRGALSGIVGGI